MPSYTEPVSRLLTVGRPLAKREWRTYRELGIGPEHIPELLAMMTDLDLHFGGDSKEKWAPVHAWRALAGLHVTEAIDPFLTLLPRLREAGEAERITEDAPEFFATIGPAALPTLLACLNDQDQSLFARWTMAESITQMALMHSQVRGDAVEALTALLRQAKRNDVELNAGLIACLMELNATESAAVIEAAYVADRVDESVVGMLEDVLYEMGLIESPPFHGPELVELESPEGIFSGWKPWGHDVPAKAKEMAKAKRKMAKAARKRNRKSKR